VYRILPISFKSLCNYGGDLREADPSFEETGNRDLVCRVEGTGIPAPAAAASSAV
jgi:hypothetical protein